jgi:hypothetical protein
MKRYLLLLFLILIQGLKTCYTYSQDTAKFWTITYYDDDFSPEHPLPTWTYYGLKTDADTTISGIQYKKLIKSYDSLFSEFSTIGGIREDSGRIYLHKWQEVLLYDFNLNANDTAVVFRYLRPYQSFVDDVGVMIDSVSTIDINGDSRKQLFVEYHCIGYPEENAKDIWVEGIGSLKNGLLNESCMCYTGCYTKSYLTCYYENNILKWTNPNFSRCVIDSSGNTNIINKYGQKPIGSRIIPHPVTDISRINSTGDFDIAQIFDIMGRHVKTYIFKNEYIEISRNDFESGFYTIILSNKSNKGVSQKLIIQ